MIALDIETVCSVTGCKGLGDYKKCDHALNPWKGRITKIGVVDGDERKVYSDVSSFWAQYKHAPGSQRPLFFGHNFKFDFLWLRVHGCDIGLDQFAHCTQIMAYVLTEKIPNSYLEYYEIERKKQGGHHRKAGKHSLKTLAPYFLDVPPFWETDDKADDEYVLKDVQYTYDLAPVLESKLKELNQWDFYLRLVGWTKMLLTAELLGITIDLEALATKEKELQTREADLRVQLDRNWQSAHYAYKREIEEQLLLKYDAMAKKAEKPFSRDSRYYGLYQNALSKISQGIDYDSPKQMAWLLRDYLGYNITSLEDKETTGREVLERLANEGKEDVKNFLEWRKVQKLLTAFIPTYKELAVAGVIHPVFNPTNTRTGRTSSERPNLQQVPPELRELFRARKGYKFISYDAAAIEAKLIALYSQDPALQRVIDSGASLHDVNTRLFFGLPEDADIKRDYQVQRQATKNVGFALFYHAGANRIRVTFANKGFHLSEQECRGILYRFKDNYEVAMEYAKSIVEYMESGKILNNLLGRPLQIENPEDAYMTAFNTLVQSSASDLNLEGAYRAWTEMKTAGLDATPLLFIHDMFLMEVREDQVEEADEILVRNLTTFDLPIKLTVEGGITSKWEK